MPLTIKAVNPDSLAADNHIKPGNKIISINGNMINDFIDLQYYSADDELDIVLLDQNRKREIHIINDWTKILGIEPEIHKCKECINKCIFCFVDQIQPGFRQTLYVKDDDFRLSFTYGNFITLTNLTDHHLNKIYEQKLSPLYVSVHTTDADLHRRILRYPIRFNIYERLQELVKNGIDLHTQIVVIPEWNDRANLSRTLTDLDKLGKGVLSIGVVPLGLTNWRKSLTPLRPVTPEEATYILETAGPYERTYCADELFILAGKSIPDSAYYNDYPQLENGIGMLRLLFQNWKKNKSKFIKFSDELKENLVFATGVSAFPFITDIANQINQKLPDKSRTVQVINNTFGSTVTVAGLLTAQDIKKQVKLQDKEIIVFSSNLFNDDQLTLDNVSLQELTRYYGNRLILVDEEFNGWQKF